MRILIVAGLLLAPQSLDDEVAKKKDDPVAALKLIAEKGGGKAGALAKRTLFAGIERDVAEGLKAYVEERVEAADRHLGRAALLSRSYSEEYARSLIQLMLGLRGRAKADGAAQIRAMASGKPLDKASLGARTWPSLADVEKRWAGKPQAAEAVDAEIAKLKIGASSSCAACKGGGDGACAGCREGMVPQACGACAAKGTVSCAVCEGKTTCDHAGFIGTVRIDIEREVRIPVGKKQMVVPPQIVTWKMAACAGKGSFEMDATSEPKAGAGGGTQHVTKKCDELWKELRRWVFNGRAKVEVSGSGGKMERLSAEAARRFFGDYDECSGGRVACDACLKRGTVTCPSCLGRTSRLWACSLCAGAGLVACTSCGLTGDGSWIAALVPIAEGPGEALANHGTAIKSWLEERARIAARAATISAQLKAAKTGLDATAKLGETAVNIACETCKGKSTTCEACWGVGRREYPEGTPTFEKYKAAAKLERLLTEALAGQKTPAPIAGLKLPETAAKPEPKTVPKPVEVPKTTGGVSDADLSTLPAESQKLIQEAEALYEKGAAHLAKAKAATDAETWTSESKSALEALRKAQAGFAAAQESLDAKGVDTPRALMEKARKCLQALVMARKQSP